jgi:hypothetical protein
MKYEPYNFDSFKQLVARAHNLGWYGGRKTLFNLKCEGDFEGWSGRASETWEQRFTLTSEEIIFDGGKKIPALDISGSSVKEVCDKALKELGLIPPKE